jgi:hypothetical protein
VVRALVLHQELRIVPLLVVSLLGEATALSSGGRVDAQRDIERARYAFVIGNSKPIR